jgi:HSP90 family molecular chaperone
VISDNGTGMNAQQLTEFATYSLDQESRGNDPSTNYSDISKFGVGAKQGGFYLGDRIHIFTKNAKEESVLEFCLDESEFEEKYRRNEPVRYKLFFYLRLKYVN